MGAAQSDLGEFEDPGPPVTKGRILKAVKWAKLPQPLTLNLCTFNFQVMGGNRRCGGGRDCGEGGECKGGGLHVQPGFHHCQGQGEGWGQDLRVGGQIYSQRGQQVFPASSNLFQPSVTNQGKLVGEHGKWWKGSWFLFNSDANAKKGGVYTLLKKISKPLLV